MPITLKNKTHNNMNNHQFSPVAQSCPTLCDPMNVNQNYNEVEPHTYMAMIRKKTSVGKDEGKKEPSYTVVRNLNRCTHYGEQYGGSLKTL